MTRIEGKKKLQERLDTTGFGRLTKELYHEFEVCDSSFIPNIFLVEPFGCYDSLQQVEISSLYNKAKLRKTKLFISDMTSLMRNIPHFKNESVKILLTMWEATKVNKTAIDTMNETNAVIVPCSWNKENFCQQGLKAPCFVVPLFVDRRIFFKKRTRSDDKFIFGVVGDNIRKDPKIVVKNFYKAFPNQNDVELHIKVTLNHRGILGHRGWGGKFLDSRVKVFTCNMTDDELRFWYNSLDCLVSPSRGEGFGLMQLESMACGVPVIVSNYGGLREYFDDTVGFPMEYNEDYVPPEHNIFSSYYWKNKSKWAEFTNDSMIENMRFCYNNIEKVKEKGLLSIERSKQFTVQKTAQSILSIIKDYY